MATARIESASAASAATPMSAAAIAASAWIERPPTRGVSAPSHYDLR